ncbi:phosphatidate cytidylyltransferase [Streptomyces albidoflavus]|uniref:phosphatidate cytidylyltransferase n=1 Tax=Streptomyces albidoflavus TaxID=1886 RepID=UPI0034539648
MNGLYALKPWYADRLSGVRGALARRRVSPDALTAAGVAAAAAAGGALALLPAGWAAAPVALLLAVRLACANLDGAVAPGWLAALAACAATLPSWVSLAGAAAGAPRLNGGPAGKTERCLLAVVAAATGWYAPVLAVIAAGSAATALLRGARLWRELDTADRAGSAPYGATPPPAVASAASAGDTR